MTLTASMARNRGQSAADVADATPAAFHFTAQAKEGLSIPNFHFKNESNGGVSDILQR